MSDIELLNKLIAAYKENNKDEFTRLGTYCEAAYEGTYVEGSFLSLYVARSTITEDDATFIGHLKQCIIDEDKAKLDAMLEKIERFEDYYEDFDGEVPEAEKLNTKNTPTTGNNM
ncbi:hypothetical protein [Fannyhessea vaginae]|uniref:hypothetical protein n=1 Tax=Fannyhessea vaginae TaxID=82135 RepID=UPI00076FD7A3|nr:hypothetical protein [Fannyhessea vaginae]KXG89726.1 hypothetical protein HMPREF3232_00772 [Fannyhessea vaginae]